MAEMPHQSDRPSDAEDVPASRIRHLIVFLAMLMAVLLYLDRFCVSFAADYIREDLSLTQDDMGWFLSAFFWSYALAQVPSGWLSDRYGARLMLAIYILTWSFFTAMIGAATSLLLLVVTRLCTGLGQAGAYPTSASVVSKWVPFRNRGTASSVIAFGGRMGGMIAPLLTAYLIVVFVPLETPLKLTEKDLLNLPRLGAKLSPPQNAESAGSTSQQTNQQTKSAAGSYGEAEVTVPEETGRYLWSRLPETARRPMTELASQYRQREREREKEEEPVEIENIQVDQSSQQAILEAFNDLIAASDLYRAEKFQAVKLPAEGLDYLERIKEDQTLGSRARQRFHRLLLEGTFPQEIGKLYVQGWRPVMVVYGLAGIVIAGAVWIFFRNRPEEHPWCNRAESKLIAEGRPPGAPSPHGKAGQVPMARLLKSRSMWFLCLVNVGTNVGWVFLVTWLPRYLLEVHEVPILQRGFMASLPLAIGFLGMLFGGRFTDYLVEKLGLLWGRRLPLLLTRFSGAMAYVFCLIFALSGIAWLNSPWFFTAAFALVAFSTDMGTGAIWSFNQDVGGRYVGSVLGWGNMWGNLGAAVSPRVYNYVLGETPSIADWNTMFLVCMGAFVLAGLCSLGVDATTPIAPPDEEHGDAASA